MLLFYAFLNLLNVLHCHPNSLEHSHNFLVWFNRTNNALHTCWFAHSGKFMGTPSIKRKKINQELFIWLKRDCKSELIFYESNYLACTKDWLAIKFYWKKKNSVENNKSMLHKKILTCSLWRSETSTYFLSGDGVWRTDVSSLSCWVVIILKKRKHKLNLKSRVLLQLLILGCLRQSKLNQVFDDWL